MSTRSLCGAVLTVVGTICIVGFVLGAIWFGIVVRWQYPDMTDMRRLLTFWREIAVCFALLVTGAVLQTGGRSLD